MELRPRPEPLQIAKCISSSSAPAVSITSQGSGNARKRVTKRESILDEKSDISDKILSVLSGKGGRKRLQKQRHINVNTAFVETRGIGTEEEGERTEGSEPKKVPVVFTQNYISTTKYSLINFIPVCLLMQFTRMSNLYFLIVTILQSIPAISPLKAYTAIVPLSFVLIIGMAKEAIEDIIRYK